MPHCNMEIKTEKFDVAVVIGRFHLHELHEAHKDLIRTVQAKHDKVLVFLGVSVVKNTLENPLDYNSRRVMLLEEFPDLQIHYINDAPGNNEVWSKNLDRLISENTTPIQTVCLYGSRDSFLSCYSGKYKTFELVSEKSVSATEIRRKICNSYFPDKSFRAGMIAATAYRYPTAYQTVDVAVVNSDGQLLLARKPNETLFRFIGGFSDPRSLSLEEDAKREVKEEAGIEVDSVTYLGSTLVDDPRYRRGRDKIKTALFVAKYVFGGLEAGDDVEFVQWADMANLGESIFINTHKPLFDLFIKKFLNNPALYNQLVS